MMEGEGTVDMQRFFLSALCEAESSAHFAELPESCQDMLVERALQNESRDI